MGIFAHMLAGGAAGGFKAWGEDIDERQKVQNQVGLLAAAEDRKVGYLSKDASQAITGMEYAKLSPEEKANFSRLEVADRKAAGAKAALDERKVAAQEQMANARDRVADATMLRAEKAGSGGGGGGRGGKEQVYQDSEGKFWTHSQLAAGDVPAGASLTKVGSSSGGGGTGGKGSSKTYQGSDGKFYTQAEVTAKSVPDGVTLSTISANDPKKVKEVVKVNAEGKATVYRNGQVIEILSDEALEKQAQAMAKAESKAADKAKWGFGSEFDDKTLKAREAQIKQELRAAQDKKLSGKDSDPKGQKTTADKAPGLIAPDGVAAPAGKDDSWKRADGSQKGDGFLGHVKTKDGKVMTEKSIGVNIDGKEIEIPALVPTLTQAEVEWMASGNKPTKAIVDKAVSHAMGRIKGGKDVFAGAGDQSPAEKKDLPQMLPLPKEKAGLKTGEVYNTARGPAKWTGSSFVPIR